jgi:hypothetical protein
MSELAMHAGQLDEMVVIDWRETPYNQPARTCLGCGGQLQPIANSRRKDACASCRVMHIFAAVSEERALRLKAEGVPTRTAPNRQHPDGKPLHYALVKIGRTYRPNKRRSRIRSERAW